MPVFKKIEGPIKKKKPPSLLKKNTRLSQITMSLSLYQKQAFGLPVETFVEPKATVVTNTRVMQ